jgi:hypothetical protein
MYKRICRFDFLTRVPMKRFPVTDLPFIKVSYVCPFLEEAKCAHFLFEYRRCVGCPFNIED